MTKEDSITQCSHLGEYQGGRQLHRRLGGCGGVLKQKKYRGSQLLWEENGRNSTADSAGAEGKPTARGGERMG